MNWINRIKKFGESIKENLNKKFPSRSERESSPWASCHGQPVLKKDLEKNLFVCPSCNHHHRINPLQRFGMLFDNGNYEVLKTPIVKKDDPLSWVDTKSYKDRLKEARKKTKQDCAILVATGKMNGINTTVAVSNFAFIGGSLGQNETEAIIYAIDHCIKNKQPFVNVCASGGARLYESLIALSGMTKVTLAINELKSNGLPYFVIYSNPVAGGVSASMAMIGDLQISEPNCLIAFSGRRVVQATVKEELPPDFQTAEFCLKHGMIDRITERKNLAKEIGILLSILLKKNSEVNSENNEQSSELSTQTREAS